MSDEEHRLLLLKMRDFEKATVGEIISPSYQAFTCYPDFTQCPNQTPQDRLAKYYEREGDALARFRLGGTERLYGFLEEWGASPPPRSDAPQSIAPTGKDRNMN